MNNKLYPPQLQGSLPACYGSALIIPFEMNKVVSWTEVKGFSVKVKSVQNNNVIFITTVNNADINKELKQLNVAIPSDCSLTIGNFYKIQIAYIKTDLTIGYYSTVGIMKYTTKPEVYIDGLQQGILSSNINTYVGVYSQEDGDSTEKVYSYRFDIRNEAKDIVETSGDLIHNHENNDNSYETHDSYVIKSNLENYQTYTIQYSVITANDLEISSPRYRIVQQTTVDAEIKADLIAEMNEENGYVDIQLVGKKDSDGIEETGTGMFLISRSSSEDSYGSWSEVCRFALYGDAPSNYHWRDFTVQHGYDYVYSLQQYNVDYQIYSNRMLSNTVTANFEHSFLYDGKRQLKIKYNSKVSSFKTNVLETKTNTIGGQYPFFFRNGNVNYKEFPISGLISYLSDEEELFLTNEELLLDDYSDLTRKHTLNNTVTSKDNDYFYNMLDANLAYKLQDEYRKRELADSNENLLSKQRLRTTNIEDYNIVAERIFKMKVLDWLNNGEPKLFRSPGEGNFIVRLMNSSLTPNDQLSRMIHTFSTTATEIDDYNYNKLNDYNMLEIADPVVQQLRWKTVLIADLVNENGGPQGETAEISIGSENNLATFQCLDMAPGDKIHIYYNDDKVAQTIQIGITGAYYAEFDESPVKITIDRTSKQGQITYSYYGTSLHYFDTYRAINMSDFPVKQFIGSTGEKDILEQMQDIKYKVTKYNFLNFVKRPVEIAYGTEEMVNPLVIYKIGDVYYDGQTKKTIDYQCKFWIDDKEVDLTETGDLYLSDFEVLPKVVLGNGVSLDASVQRREIEYDVERNDADVSTLRNAYIDALNALKVLVQPLTDEEAQNDFDNELSVNNYNSLIQQKTDNVNATYQIFIDGLTAALKAKEVLDIE